MDQRISFITLAVENVPRSRRFYVDGLEWEPMFEDGDVIMLPVGEHLLLSLWSVEGFTAEIGEAPVRGIAPIALAHNCATEEEVDRVLSLAASLGANTPRGAQGLGRVFRLLLRPRRLPVGDRDESRAHR
ncbi:VOC family protein [Leucobacter soli]|uniref:VOC family protein n=1 Tax=Leucobacter soli TaxID=2812850 RepID=UPI0036123B54